MEKKNVFMLQSNIEYNIYHCKKKQDKESTFKKKTQNVKNKLLQYLKNISFP